MITGIHHVQLTIPRGCEQQAREFYCHLLGFTEIPKPDNLLTRGGFWLKVGDRELHIGVEDRVERLATKAHVAYAVRDLAAWRTRLAARLIDIQEGLPIPGFSRFEFRDPFGNRVEFIEPAATDSP
jgi:catechol 2,3-dioxygenase-like lactoylglutathione lyase family enzyme